MKTHLGYLLGFAAITLASTAAFFSIYGLSQLFAGASLAVIIMATTLEFSKIIIASYLHSYWSSISKVMKVYFMIGTIILVLITSAGIYGFLSNAYQKTANSLEIFDGEVSNSQTKIDQFMGKVDTNQKSIDLKYKRVTQLSDIRANQEARLDLKNTQVNRLQITNSNIEIERLNGEIDLLNNDNSKLGDSITKYKTQIVELKGTNIAAGEVGPLKYMSELSGLPMNQIVNYFILLLVFVFDPLAISLVIATITVFKSNKSVKIGEKKEVVLDVEPVDEVEVEIEGEPEDEPVIQPEVVNKRKPIELEDIREYKQLMNRGFTPNIPPNNNDNNVIFDKNGRKK